MALRAVIFDLDGTLLDTLSDIAYAMNTALSERGMPTHRVAAYRLMVGSGIRVLAQRATGFSDTKQIDAIAARAKEIYGAHPVVHTAPYPGIAEMLDELERLGIPMAVLSNKPDHLTVEVVSQVLGTDRFAAVRGAREEAPIKPEPSGALDVAATIDVDPTEMLYLGDTDVDMITATRAGMYAVGATWGFRDADSLLAAGARRLIDEPGELPGIFEAGLEAQDGDSRRG
jgi:phosphoglycolate phosphatase